MNRQGGKYTRQAFGLLTRIHPDSDTLIFSKEMI